MKKLYLSRNTMLFINQLLAKKNAILLILLLLLSSFEGFSQYNPVPGDFRAIGSGIWYESTTWTVYDGSSWILALEGEYPGKENSVYIDASATVFLDSSAVCKDLHINIDASVNLDTATLEVWGALRFFENPLPGNEVILPDEDPGKWISSGKEGALRFRGDSDRTIIAPGSGGTTNGLTGYNLEIAFDEGSRATIEENFRVDSLTVQSGTFAVTSAALFAGNSDVSGGSIVITNHSVFLPPTTGIYRTSTSPFSLFLLDSLATMTISGDNLIIAASDLQLAGLVELEEDIPIDLNFPSNNAIAGAAPIAVFNHLSLTGSTEKILSEDITVNGVLSLVHPDDLIENGFTLTYGSQGSLQYAGTDPVLTSDKEFPGLNGPSNLIISNPNVALHADRVLTGQLTMNGGLLYLGNNDLIFGPDSPPVAGTFSVANMVAVSNTGTGQLKKIFNEPGAFYFPVGEDHLDLEYTPADLTVTAEGFLMDTVGLRPIDDKFPGDISDFGYLSRYWEVTASENLTIDADFYYHEDDATVSDVSTNAYHYYEDTLQVYGAVNSTQKLLSYRGVELKDINYFTGSNWGKVTNNVIDATLTDYCGTIDLPEITGTLLQVGGVESVAEFIWERRFNEGDWTEIPSAIGQNFDPVELSDSGFYEFRRRALPQGDSIYHLSNVLSFNLYPELADFEDITPSASEFCVLGSGLFIAGEIPTGGDGYYFFQWERSSDGGATFDIVGDDFVHYTETEDLTPGTYLYRRGVFSVCGEYYSDIAEIRVYDTIDDNVVSYDESNYCGLPGGIEVNGSAPSGGSGTYIYSWERKIPGELTFEVIGGNTKDLVDNDITEFGEYQYRRTVSSGPCADKISNTLSILVYPELSENAISREADLIYCGTNTEFTIDGTVMTGGDGAYSYIWERRKDGGEFADLSADTVAFIQDAGLSPGTYSYLRTVISASCRTTSDTLEVIILPPVTNNVLTTPDQLAYCGLPLEITLSGSEPDGGNGSFVYSWERRIDNGLEVGEFSALGNLKDLTDTDITTTGRYEYRRMVSSGACEAVASDTIVINVYPVLSENSLTSLKNEYCFSPEDVIIYGSTMEGGDGTYVYVWEKSIDGVLFEIVGSEEDYQEPMALAPGKYQYRRTVTSSVCSSTSEIYNLEVQPPLANNFLVQPTAENSIFCTVAEGFTIEGSVPTGGNQNYLYKYERQFNEGEWEEVGNGKDYTEEVLDIPGVYNYRRKVYTNLCLENVSDTVSILVSAPIEITANITATIDDTNSGAIDLQVTGGTPPYSFFWTNLSDTEDIDNLDGMDYSVSIMDANNCVAEETFTVPRITGIADNPLVNSYKIYPNPVNDLLNIEASFKKAITAEMYIINSLGKTIARVKPMVTARIDLQIDMSSYPKGIYFIKVLVDGEVETLKFIKE